MINSKMYEIKEYDKNGFLKNVYSGYDDLEMAKEDIEHFKKIDADENEIINLEYEIVEVE